MASPSSVSRRGSGLPRFAPLRVSGVKEYASGQRIYSIITFHRGLPLLATSIHKVHDPEEPVIKGSREGLRILLPIKASFEDTLKALSGNLEAAGNFFSGARAIIEPSRDLSAEEQAGLKELLARHAIELTKVRSAQRAVSAVAPVKPLGEPAIAIRRTVRSGQRIAFDGSVVIFGDVNPGGEVIASGDIAVFGALRGVAHAGAAGDRKAVVAALSLRPVQLRIADLIVRAPEGEVRTVQAEVARIKNGSIVVEPYHIGARAWAKVTHAR